VFVASCSLVQRGGADSATKGARWGCASLETVAPLRTWVASYAAPQSADADTYRIHIGLPRVPNDSVVVVTASQTCADAGRAYARATDQHLAARLYEVAVVRAGNRYVVRNATAPVTAGEWNLMLIFDTAFHPKDTILGF